MNRSVAILGRQPGLGIAEYESLYGSNAIIATNKHAAVIDVPPEQIDFRRLGGSIKLTRVLTVLDTLEWQDISDYLVRSIPEHAQSRDDGKLTLGISAHGLRVSPKRINATALSVKKAVKATGRSCRIVPNKSSVLSSAQVLHNKLFTAMNWELNLIAFGDKTYLTQTTNVQDIEAYAARDQARPKRDAKVGMLPPKLAQIIVNLAQPGDGETVLDPFCGTGVILQEALLMGYYVYGTDIEPRMIDYSLENLRWLIGPAEQKAHTADATEANWEHFDTIACETYLGRPFTTTPERSVLQKIITDVDTIHKKFLRNVARQTKSGFRMCIAVPAWRVGNGFKHLPTLDHLEDLGYTRLVFKHVGQEDLIYHREGQVVGRELIVLVRK